MRVLISMRIGFTKGNEEDYSLSENGASYWVCNLILGLGGRIMKDTEEGKNIASMLEKCEYKSLETYLNTIALKYSYPSNLIRLINAFGKEKFNEGRESLKIDIKKLIF